MDRSVGGSFATGARGEGGAREVLAQVLDEHGELGEILAQLEATEDRELLRGVLARLEAFLGRHFRQEEDGLLGLLAVWDAEAARKLSAEHGEILAATQTLAERVQRGSAALDVLLREGVGLARRLREHDAREAALLREQAGVESLAPAAAGRPASAALEANLRRTAVAVAIPPEERVLLECTAHLHGVHEGTRALLREIHHRYVGWAQTLDDLHRRAMGDLCHYLAQPRAAEAVEVFFRLYEKVVREASSLELRETALRRYLQYLLAVAGSEQHPPGLRERLVDALARLRARFAASPDLALEAAPGLRRLVETLAGVEGAEGPATAAALRLLEAALREGLLRWLAGEDPAQWWAASTEARAGSPPPEAVAALSHERIREQLERLESLAGAPAARRANELPVLPDHTRLARGCLDVKPAMETPEGDDWRRGLARIRWLLRVLGTPGLHTVHEDALVEIQHAGIRALRGADTASVASVVRELFESLRARGLSTSPAALALISRLGEEILKARQPAWTEAFVDGVLDWDFAYPEFAGFTEEWKLRSHPAHARAIRTFLTLVESDPEASRPLVAALVVHLRLGGVALADTEIFQRDISKLLASGVEAVYHPLKHLLRILPVYFDEIGAEGELREVSSRIDEVDGRRDPLCHFLRKQAHVESNPEILGLVEAVGRFWATGERDCLRGYLPASVWGRLEAADPRLAGLHRLFAELVGDEAPEALFSLDEAALESRLAQAVEGDEIAREKARLLVRMRRLLGRKYEIRHDDVLRRLAASRLVPGEALAALQQHLTSGDEESALDVLLGVLETLKDVALRPGPVEANEQIYRKRHVAVGIPSLYGSYREERFDAMGLSLRLESLARALLDRLLSRDPLQWITRDALRRVGRRLLLLRRALRIDGCRARGLGVGVAMFEQALDQPNVGLDRWLNVLQVLSRSVEQIVGIRFLEVYEEPLARILRRMIERGVVHTAPDEDVQEVVLKRSEAFLRDLVAESFGLQQLDDLVGRVLRGLAHARDALPPAIGSLLVGYDAEQTCVEIDGEPGPCDGALHLGNKGYMLERLVAHGLPVPSGFLLTTELFRCRPLLEACPELEGALADQLRGRLRRLEEGGGRRFGDPRRPLLLSVRSTAAISMPGVLDTFLNVGINAEIAEGFGRHTGSPWAAWDAWRRFLQQWGMAYGLERDLFDALMQEAKRRHGAAKKVELPAERMRELAFRYRELLRDHRLPLAEDPFAQLRACVDLVLQSWHAEKARLYRAEMQVADAWGTAVIVQSMVYGNLHPRAGTGVLRTLTPRGRPGEVAIVGDFVVQGQGDDVVGGLVETFPISAAERPAARSLEHDFPAIHAALARHARTLLFDMGTFHQEIEFTFESERAEDLYILQARDSVMASLAEVPAFVPTEALAGARLATGIGAGGGALSGRAAHRAADVEALRQRFPDDPIVLLRPDTVPDDLPLVLRCQGLLTVRGGATSHAALVAQRLGRTCVVGCRPLDVSEEEGVSRIAGHLVRMGDWLSINGMDGSVYRGRHPTARVRRERLV